MSRPSETEQELRRAAEAGEVLDLSRRGDNRLPAKAIRDLLRADDVDPLGVQVRGARITGQLDLDNIRTSTALDLDNCVLDSNLSLVDTELPSLSLDGCTMPAFYGAGLHTRYLGMYNAHCTFTLSLDNARIDGRLVLDHSSTGRLSAIGLHVSRNLTAFRLLSGEMRLDGCDLGDDLNLREAVIVTRWNPAALVLDNARIGGDAHLDRIFVKAGDNGCGVTMIDAKAGSLRMPDALVRTAASCGVRLDGSRFRGDVRLDEGFDARSKRTGLGTIRVVGARINGSLDVQGPVRNDEGPAVIVRKSAVSGTLAVRDIAPRSAVAITDTEVGGSLDLDLLSLREASVTVHGLTYPEPPGDTDAWLTMLREQNARYEAQPYQQLAAAHRAAGHEHTARKVLIAQQRDLRRRGDPGNKLWHRILGVTLGYGYQPSRALIGLLATFVLALCLVWTTNAYNGLTPAAGRPADSCSPVNRISLAADLAIPLVKLGGTPRCELANGPAGQWATGAGWVVQILGWSFATLSVAGFTGLVRKT